MKKRLLTALLCMCMVLALFPAVTIRVNAAGMGAISLSTSGILGGGTNWVYYGAYASSPVKWRVLAKMGGNGGTYTDNSGKPLDSNDVMFLLSEYIWDPGTVAFDSDGVMNTGQSNIKEWQGSDVQAWCTSRYNDVSYFTPLEKGAIAATTKTDPFNSTYGPCALFGDHIFFLSYYEVIDTAYGFSNDNARLSQVSASNPTIGSWLLRTPYMANNLITLIYWSGSPNYAANITDPYSARPAFNINLKSVLFASSAAGGKSAAGMDSQLTGVWPVPSTDWKLTLCDSSRNFNVTESSASAASGGKVTLKYSGATAYDSVSTPNEYISAMIADAGDNIIYYGRIAQPVSTDGNVDIVIPPALPEGSYTLKVFSEQYNGDYETDLASEFSNVALTVDNTVPSVTISSSVSGATNASSIPVMITFNENVTGFDSSDLVIINGTAGNFSGSGKTYTADITPTSEGTITVDIAADAAQDVAKNGNTAATQFTCTYDNSVPTIDTLTPSSTGNPIIGDIKITFNEAMNSVAGAVYLSDDGGLTYGSSLSGGNWSAGNTVYTISYDTLAYSAVYNVIISGFKDAVGNTMANDSTHSFTTMPEPDKTPPTVSSVTPSSADASLSGNIAVTFSEVMNTSAGAVSLNGGTSLTGGNWSADYKTYTAPYSGLSFGTAYTIAISGFKDAAGNTMASDSTHSFTTKANSSSGVGGSSAVYYTITATAGKGGSISPSGSIYVSYGNSKTYTIAAEKGYKIENILVDDVSVGAVSTYIFENVKKAHTITASFKKIETRNPFTDVDTDDWFYDPVMYVYKNGLMIGTGPDMFSPNGTMTRAMIVTILYRMSGDTGSYTNPFSDIPSGSWYKTAVAWAAKNGVASGVGGNQFAPKNSLTREQLAVMLYNYAKYRGVDVSVGKDTNILSYNDALSISKYAYSALQWSCVEGVIIGDSNGNLNPQSPVTRAEVAAILQRFIENVTKTDTY